MYFHNDIYVCSDLIFEEIKNLSVCLYNANRLLIVYWSCIFQWLGLERAGCGRDAILAGWRDISQETMCRKSDSDAEVSGATLIVLILLLTHDYLFLKKFSKEYFLIRKSYNTIKPHSYMYYKHIYYSRIILTFSHRLHYMRKHVIHFVFIINSCFRVLHTIISCL